MAHRWLLRFAFTMEPQSAATYAIRTLDRGEYSLDQSAN